MGVGRKGLDVEAGCAGRILSLDIEAGCAGGMWRLDIEAGCAGGMWRLDIEAGCAGGAWLMFARQTAHCQDHLITGLIDGTNSNQPDQSTQLDSNHIKRALTHMSKLSYPSHQMSAHTNEQALIPITSNERSHT